MTALPLADALRIGSSTADKVYLGSAEVWPTTSTPGDSVAATLTIPAGTVGSTLANFPVRVDLTDMPAGWWNDVAIDGGNIRIKQAGTVIPFDLVWIDVETQQGELFFKASSLASGSDNAFTVDKAGDDLLAATDTNGRNAVWSDYDAMFVFPGGMVNRTGSGVDVVTEGSLFSYLPDSLSPSVGVDKQGITRDDDGNTYIIRTTAIAKYDPDWNLVVDKTTALADAGVAGVNHFGDGCIYDGELYAPFENWDGTSGTIQRVGVWDLATLTFQRVYDVSANSHEVAALCHNPDDGLFYIADYTSPGASLLHKYDTNFNHVGTLALASAVSNKNGLDYADGSFLITAPNGLSDSRIYRVSADGTTIEQIWSDTRSEIEGLCIDKATGDLYYHYKGGPLRIYRAAGWLGSGRFGNAWATGLPKRTSWTMGATAVTAEDRAVNRGLLSYSSLSTATGDRASLLIRSTTKAWNLWNSTNSWLPTSSAPGHAVRARLHHTQNGTSGRAVYYNGVLANSGAAAQRPGGAGDTLFILVESLVRAERFQGAVNYVYLRDGVLSADWLAAEYASWETPSSFYAVTTS